MKTIEDILTYHHDDDDDIEIILAKQIRCLKTAALAMDSVLQNHKDVVEGLVERAVFTESNTSVLTDAINQILERLNKLEGRPNAPLH